MKLSLRAEQPLRGDVSLPGDKSISHRAALFAALADGGSRFTNYLDAGVTRKMLSALRALGVEWRLEDGVLEVTGTAAFAAPGAALDCGNSATTLRLLAGALAGSGTGAVLDGSPGLRKRPMGRIVRPLQAMGVPIRSTQASTAPLELISRHPRQSLLGLTHNLEVASAQVKTCILLAGLGAEQPTRVIEPGPSRDHTERMLASMGVQVTHDRETHHIELVPPNGPLKPVQMEIPGDFSSAAFLLVAACLVPGSRVTLRGVGLNPTRTGLLDALRAMGACILVANREEIGGEPVGDLIVEAAPLHGVAVDGDLVVRMIDEFPAFAIAACLAEDITEVRDASELRYKETDRISVLCVQLARLGVRVEELPDGMRIHGGERPPGGECDARKDHRLAMSLALVGLFSKEPVTVHGAEIIRESFPDFTRTLASLGASIETQEDL